jgi:hypothetical protein
MNEKDLKKWFKKFGYLVITGMILSIATPSVIILIKSDVERKNQQKEILRLQETSVTRNEAMLYVKAFEIDLDNIKCNQKDLKVGQKDMKGAIEDVIKRVNYKLYGVPRGNEADLSENITVQDVMDLYN